MQYWKILLFMKRKPGISVEAFRDYYENHHVPLALGHSAMLSRYVRRYLEPRPNPDTGESGELPYDVVTELWFEDEATWRGTVQYLETSVMPDEIVLDELNLFDRPTMRMATVVECETDMAAVRARLSADGA
ncbi:MAG: ethyl tert-butyl ether degradation protein EthD [Novosphingobium sp.]|nr:ethyl tert-butyl ether degradation protein EthD [Novosphingobium sp.]